MTNAKSVEKLTHNINIFYVSMGMKGMAITMPHAVLTLIFLSKGMTYSQIATIQAFYSMAVVLFEFPSGVLADRYNKKSIFIMSNITMLFCYVMVLFFDSFVMMALAWFLYGISNAFETGTIDAHIIVSIKRTCHGDEVQKKLEKFIGTGSSLTAAASIAGAGLGFALYQLIDIHLYYLMIVFMSMSALLIFFQYKYRDVDREGRDTRMKQLVKDSFKELKNSPSLRWIILCFGALQMYLQVHFQMWQSFFLEVGYNEKLFLGFYLLFQIITIIVYKLPISKIMEHYLFCSAIGGIGAAIFLFLSSHKVLTLVLYCIPVVVILMLGYYLQTIYNLKVKEENISSLTSLSSTITRCFSVVTLLAASMIIDAFSLKVLYLVFPILSIAFVSLICKKLMRHS
ncbi:MAG: MFS transporter [Lachnospiraceae bacterium]|jgi:MFS family permease|nr:MFS transporter [Lachnospiraceae bacterium]